MGSLLFHVCNALLFICREGAEKESETMNRHSKRWGEHKHAKAWHSHSSKCGSWASAWSVMVWGPHLHLHLWMAPNWSHSVITGWLWRLHQASNPLCYPLRAIECPAETFKSHSWFLEITSGLLPKLEQAFRGQLSGLAAWRGTEEASPTPPETSQPTTEVGHNAVKIGNCWSKLLSQLSNGLPTTEHLSAANGHINRCSSQREMAMLTGHSCHLI